MAKDEREPVRRKTAVIRFVHEENGWLATARYGRVTADGSGRTLTAARAAAIAVLTHKVNESWWAAHPDEPRHKVLLSGHVPVREVIELPQQAQEALDAALEARAAAQAASRRATETLREAALALDDAGLSLRDAGHVLELSHARIAQVLEQPRPSPGGDR